MLTVHHLGVGQSERIVWLLEELGLQYNLVTYTRDSVTRLSPPALKAMHPLGAAPLLEDGELLLAESGAIAEYVIEVHASGRLRPRPGEAGYAAFLYWFHAANANLQPAVLSLFLLSRAGLADDSPAVERARGRVERLLGLLDDQLSRGDYLAGAEFTAADIMAVFSLTTMRLFQPIDLEPYPRILAYLQRIGERPAYQRAMAKSDPGMTPNLK